MDVKLKSWLVVGLFLGTAVYAIAEDITLTTYYPSPRGVYQELKTAGDLIVGDITNPPAARLHIVQEGTAAALRVDDELSDTSPVLVDASGNVGIGTTTPATMLDVAGGIRPGTPAAGPDGTLRWNAATTTLQISDGTNWVDVGGGQTYDTGWFSIASTSAYTFTHDLGVIPRFVQVYGRDSNGNIGLMPIFDNNSLGPTGYVLYPITPTQVSLRTAASAIFVCNHDYPGCTDAMTATQARIILMK